MKYTLFVYTDRVKFLLETLRDKAKVVREDIDNGVSWTKLEITIDDSIDLMNVFHAGCKIGMSNTLNK